MKIRRAGFTLIELPAVRQRKRAAFRGFTLIELLVASAIVAILSLTLFASLQAAYKGRHTAEAAIEAGRASRLALDAMAREIQRALRPRGILAGAFIGTDGRSDAGRDGDTLVLHNTADATRIGERRSDIQQVTLGLSEDALVKQVQRNLLASVEQPLREQVISRGVAELNFRYFDGSTWLDEWDSTLHNDTLPLAVEITLGLAQKEGDEPRRSVRVVALPCAADPEVSLP